MIKLSLCTVFTIRCLSSGRPSFMQLKVSQGHKSLAIAKKLRIAIIILLQNNSYLLRLKQHANSPRVSYKLTLARIVHQSNSSISYYCSAVSAAETPPLLLSFSRLNPFYTNLTLKLTFQSCITATNVHPANV